MANHECEITDLEAQVVLPPAEDPNFLTPGYVAPTDVLLPWMNIRIFYTATDYREFNPFYVAGSGQGEGVYGSRGLASITLRDNNPAGFDWPFDPIDDLYIELSDELGEIFTGYIQNQPTELLGLRPDGTPLRLVTLECEDLWSQLERDTYNEIYLNKTVGFILRDAFTRAGFDVSEIDPALGPTYTRYPVDELHPVDVVTPLLGLLDYTYWIEGPTRKVRVHPRDTVEAEILRVNEANWSYLFDNDLELTPDKAGYANKLVLTHQLKWNAGTANFDQGQDVVLGYTGFERWCQLPKGELTIENLLTGMSYRIGQNNSDDEETNELILESAYKEVTTGGTGTNVPYLIRGALSKVVERDTSGILRRQALGLGSGVVTKTIQMDNIALFPEEARRVAKAELAIAKRDMYFGSARSDSHRLRSLLTSAPQPGRTIYFDLPKTKKVQGWVRIESWRWQDISTRDYRDDGTKVQGRSIELEFTPSVTREQIREITKQLARTGASSDDATIQDVEAITNIVVFKDCLSVVPALKAADKNIFEAEDTLTHREVQIKTWYFAPATTHPDSEAYFTGMTKFSNFS